jgi:hypothetical protein
MRFGPWRPRAVTAALLSLVVLALLVLVWCAVGMSTSATTGSWSARDDMYTSVADAWADAAGATAHARRRMRRRRTDGLYELKLDVGPHTTEGLFDTGSGHLLVGVRDARIVPPPAARVASAQAEAITYASQSVRVASCAQLVRFKCDASGHALSVEHPVKFALWPAASPAAVAAQRANFVDVFGFACTADEQDFVTALMTAASVTTWGFALGTSAGVVYLGPCRPPSALCWLDMSYPPSFTLNVRLLCVPCVGLQDAQGKAVSVPEPLWVALDTGMRMSFAPQRYQHALQSTAVVLLGNGVVFKLPQKWPQDSSKQPMRTQPWAQQLLMLGADMLCGTHVEVDAAHDRLSIVAQQHVN